MTFERHQAVTVDPGVLQCRHAAKLRQIDDERRTDDVALQVPDQLRRRDRRSPRRYKIIDNQDALAFLHRICVDFDSVGAILERILLPDRLPRQLALFADRHEPAAQSVGDSTAKNKSARFDPRHSVDRQRPERLRQLRDRRLEALRVAEQRGDIPEHDPGLRVIRDRPDQVLQVAQQTPPRQIHGANYQYPTLIGSGAAKMVWNDSPAGRL
jgi:hypothetical protein